MVYNIAEMVIMNTISRRNVFFLHEHTYNGDICDTY